MYFQEENGTKLSLIYIDIADSQTDVIVNTVAKNLNFSSSAVSKALLAKAGTTLQDEAQSVCPDLLKVGQVIVTSGGNLRCKKVYHCSPRTWRQGKGQCEGELRNLVDVCLEKAHSDTMTSISFPAMSTGAGGVPRDMVARAMFEQVEQFCKSHGQTTLQDIHFVIYHGDQETITVFRQYMDLQNKKTPLSSSQAQEKETSTSGIVYSENTSEASPVNKENISQTTGRKTEDTSVSEIDLEAAAAASSAPPYYTGCIIDVTTNLIVRVKQSDITEATTDAIVNTTNKNFSAAGGVAKAIFEAGGASLKEECTRLGKIRDGVALTKAGDLPCKYVIHIAAPVVQSEWYGLIKKALKLAEKENLKSLSFPALGTGVMSVSPDVMAKEMGIAIYSHAHKHNKTIADIDICIFDENVTPIFESTLKTFFHSKMTGGFKGRREVAGRHSSIDEGRAVPLYGGDALIEGIVEAIAKMMSLGPTNIKIPDPSNWDEMPPDQDLDVVKLKDSSQEYKEIANSIENVIEPYNIKKIERLQNRRILSVYQTIKSMMKTPGERTLWHGTKREAVDSINVQGFDRQRHGENGIKYGKGTYFAKSPSYSKHYAVPDSEGLSCLYQCKVLTGKFTLGDESMLAPPPTNPTDAKKHHVLYDSLVNDVNDPAMFVVFQDNQACPEYLITFKSN